MTASRNVSGRIFWGLILIIIGILFLLDRMGQIDFGSLFSKYWPLLLILAGLWHLLANNFRNPAGGVFLIIIGGVFMLAKLEILGRSAWHYAWPLLLIILGVWLLFGLTGARSPERSSGAKEDELDAFVMFSGLKRRIESQNFRGGKATSVLGGIELDFTQARLAEGKASVELTAVLGGIEVRAPQTWRVEVEGQPLLGGIEDKHTFAPGTETAPTLHLKASAILGGIEIKG
jgi:predicted membrane protein